MAQDYSEQSVEFIVNEQRLHGVLSVPEQETDTAVIIVVGGPQFRVGSHRQFVLLARFLANNNICALRFDYSGMGYSEGIPKNFYQVDDDIKAAVDFIKDRGYKKIFVWGLCDAAAAISFYAHSDSRINGAILLNPWVRSEVSHSKVLLSSYYKDRWFNLEVWKDLLKSPRKIIAAAGSILNVIFKVLSAKKKQSNDTSVRMISEIERLDDLASAIFKGLTWFPNKICLILSTNDLTAKEFEEALEEHQWLETAGEKVEMQSVAGANHTFSTAAWRNTVETLTLDFIRRNT